MNSDDDPFALSDNENSEKNDLVGKYLFSRPGEQVDSDVVITLPSGDRYYMLLNKLNNLKTASVDYDDTSTSYLSNDKVQHMLQDIQQQQQQQQEDLVDINSQVLLHNLQTNEEDIDSDVEQEDEIRNQLWVSKYGPKKFVDLVSDGRTNRLVLKWLKSWDNFVFNKKVKRKDLVMVDENIGASDGRPSEKIILLSGPPGSGKSTLAHVAAVHAGYCPVEINASDERTGKVLEHRILSAMDSMSAFEDSRPKCIILDEIEGVANQGEGNGAIGFLLNLLKAPLKFGKKRNRKSLRRPIICICNDAYSAVLRPLRQQGFHVTLKAAKETNLVQRLFEICKKEEVSINRGSLKLLCDSMDCDIRGCLHALEFLKRKSNKINNELVKGFCTSRRDKKSQIFETLETVYHVSTSRKHKNLDFDSILSVVAKHGADFEIVMAGIHENLVHVKFADALLENTSKALDSISHFDQIYYQIRSKQNYSMVPYLPFVGVEVSSHCACEAGTKPQFPQKYFQFASSFRNNRLALSGLCSLGKGSSMMENPGYLLSGYNFALDLSYYVKIVSPINSPGSFKLVDMIHVLDSFSCGDDKEFEQRIVKKKDVRSVCRKRKGLVLGAQKDFFGREDKRVKLNFCVNEAVTADVGFYFNEGFTNAVRRPVKMSEFLVN